MKKGQDDRKENYFSPDSIVLSMPEDMHEHKHAHIRIRTGARTASKVQETELVSKAKRMGEKPDLILPRCGVVDRRCAFCLFDKIRKKMEKIQGNRDSETKLKWSAAWGNQLTRAYAATLLLALSEKAPYLAVAKYPFGTVTYAIRGRVKKEKLIGVQNFDKPKWRLFAVADLALRGYHFYSAQDSMFCTGLEPSPPKRFLREVVNSSRYQFESEGNLYRCSHLSKDDVENRRAETLILKWRSAGLTFALCSKCASKKENLFATLTERMAVPDAKKDFSLKAVYGLGCAVECEECILEKEVDIPQNLAKDYFEGKLSDGELLARYIDEFESMLFAMGKRCYIANHKCYAQNTKKFLESMNPKEEEAEALKAMLKCLKVPIVAYEPSPSRLLAAYWDEGGLAALTAVAGDTKIAEELFERGKEAKENPSNLLREAKARGRAIKVISKLPAYKKLPPVASFVDSVARIYRSEGLGSAIKVIDKCDKSDVKKRAIGYAFLLALNEAHSRSWQYGKEEKELAEFLKEQVGKLLRTEGNDYDSCLRRIVLESGAAEEF